MLDRAAILAAEDRHLTTISVPEWGGDVYVRPMTGTDRDAYEAELLSLGEANSARMANMRGRVCARILCDQDGVRLFSDADSVVLGEKSATALDRIFTIALKLNGIGPKAVDTAGKTSAGDQSVSSGSGSQPINAGA